jgi:hypothetical protein
VLAVDPPSEMIELTTPVRVPVNVTKMAVWSVGRQTGIEFDSVFWPTVGPAEPNQDVTAAFEAVVAWLATSVTTAVPLVKALHRTRTWAQPPDIKRHWPLAVADVINDAVVPIACAFIANQLVPSMVPSNWSVATQVPVI